MSDVSLQASAVPVIDVTPHELVVWKPPKLVSELPRDPNADSLVRRLNAQGFANLRLVHRLDSPACGVMVVARTAEAAAHYSSEIAARRWRKVYVAEVACGLPRATALLGEHKAYLAAERFKAHVVRSGGKPSFLNIFHAAATADPDRCLVAVRLLTGRFHQIRVMLSWLGAPLAGDSVYGGPEGRFYLEQVGLAARPFGEERMHVWRAPRDAERPEWPPSLLEAIETEFALFNAG
jgi:23S rRNA-/tRNA-specific pseudouridylate synthase